MYIYTTEVMVYTFLYIEYNNYISKYKCPITTSMVYTRDDLGISFGIGIIFEDFLFFWFSNLPQQQYIVH